VFRARPSMFTARRSNRCRRMELTASARNSASAEMNGNFENVTLLERQQAKRQSATTTTRPAHSDRDGASDARRR